MRLTRRQLLAGLGAAGLQACSGHGHALPAAPGSFGGFAQSSAVAASNAIKFLLTDETGALYVITAPGNVYWYKDLAVTPVGAASSYLQQFANEGVGQQIASGWPSYAQVAYGGNGMIYAIDAAGDVFWYRDLARNGTADWAPNSGAKIAAGWNAMLATGGGSPGELYVVNSSGNLVWYKDVAQNGTAGFDSSSGAVLAPGWNKYGAITSGGGGVIYAIEGTQIFWFQDLAQNGTSNFAPGSGNAVASARWSNAMYAGNAAGYLYSALGNGYFARHKDLARNASGRWDTLGWQDMYGAWDAFASTRGYVVPLSAGPGESVAFKLTAGRGISQAQLSIYRLHVEGIATGNDDFGTLVYGPVSANTPWQPVPAKPWSEDHAWQTSLTQTIPSTWTSGMYAALLKDDTGSWFFIPFVVRANAPQTSTVQGPIDSFSSSRVVINSGAPYGYVPVYYSNATKMTGALANGAQATATGIGPPGGPIRATSITVSAAQTQSQRRAMSASQSATTVSGTIESYSSTRVVVNSGSPYGLVPVTYDSNTTISGAFVNGASITATGSGPAGGPIAATSITIAPVTALPNGSTNGMQAAVAVISHQNSWNAYNTWGGLDQYTNPNGTPLTFNRPNVNSTPLGSNGPNVTVRAELYIYSFLDDAAINYDLYTDIDLQNGTLQPNLYRAIVLNAHPEYFSLEMRTALANFVAGGGNLIYLGGNGIYERVVFDSTNSSIQFRQNVSSSPPPPRWTYVSQGLSEAQILGVQYSGTARNVYAGLAVEDASHPFFAGTGVTHGQLIGTSGLNGNGASGYEWDVIQTSSPAGTTLLAQGQNGGSGANLSTRQTSAGGFVFAAASLAFGGSLMVDPVLKQLLKNVLNAATS